jgi:hypothetical protein
MTTKRPIGPRIDANRQPCDVPRCPHARHGASRYCGGHKRRNAQHGHPEGRRIFPKEYRIERRTVAAILSEHANHEGVKVAREWLDAWLERAAAGDKNATAPAEFSRLAAAGVTGERILEECASVWMFSVRYPRTLPDDARLTFALATAVLHLAPRYLRKTYHYASYRDRRYFTASKEDRHAIGKAIRDTLGPLLWNIATHPERTAQEHEARRRALFAPLTKTVDLLIPHPITQ